MSPSVVHIHERDPEVPDEQTAKVSVSVQLDSQLVQRMENASRHLPPGWEMTRILEVGAVELLERLERKWNKGKPFPPSKSASQKPPGSSASS
jgi:hypothetical protein